MKKLLLATLALAFTQAHAAESLLERINNHGTVTRPAPKGTYAAGSTYQRRERQAHRL